MVSYRDYAEVIAHKHVLNVGAVEKAMKKLGRTPIESYKKMVDMGDDLVPYVIQYGTSGNPIERLSSSNPRRIKGTVRVRSHTRKTPKRR